MSEGALRPALRPALTAALLAGLIVPGPAGAQAPPSPGADAQEGALFLLLPTGAKAVGMARAMTALSSDEAAFWNPAGLAEVGRSRILLYRGDHPPAGEAFALSAIYARPPVGTLAISYQLLDVGEQQATDRAGNVVGSVSFRNHLAVASFATTVASRISTGVNFKVIQRRISCEGQCLGGDVTATTFALDGGIQARPTTRIPLRIGVMLAHLGPDFQVVNADQADPLPTRLRISTAYEIAGHFLPYPDLDFWVTVEMEDRWRNPGSPSMYIGGEFTAGATDAFYVRAGYEAGEGGLNQGAAVGVGVRYERFDLDLAKSLARSSLTGDSQPVHLTLALLLD